MVGLLNPRVLVVDDDDEVRALLVDALQTAGFETAEAATGEEALRCAARQPDAIVLDVRLPDVSGLDVCRRVRAGPLTSSIPVLIVSGFLLTEEDRAIALASGADLCMTKPLKLGDLCAAVTTLLRVRRADDEAQLRLAQARLLVGQLSGSLNLADVLARLGEVGCDLLDADAVRVRLLDPATDELRLVSATGAPSPRFDAPLRSNEAFPGYVLAGRRTVAVDDILGDPRFEGADLLAAEGLASVIGVPLLFASEPLGTLMYWSRTRRAWSAEDVIRAETLGAHAATAICNARLFEDSERRRRIAESLADVGRLISQSLDPGEVSLRVVDSLRRLLDVEAVGLYRLVAETGELRLTSRSHAFEWLAIIPPGMGSVGLAVRERKPVATPDLLTDPRITIAPGRRESLRDSRYRAALSTPLLVHDRIIGVLVVSAAAGRVFSDEEIQIASAFASHAAVALENSRLFTEHIEIAVTLEARERQQAAIARLGHRAIAAEEIGPLLDAAVDTVAETLRVDCAAVFELAPSGDTLAVRAGAGTMRAALGAGISAGPDSHVGRALVGDGPVLLDETASAVQAVSADLLSRHGVTSGVATVVEGLIPPFGVLGAYSERPRPFSNDEITFLQAVAGVIGAAMVRIKTESTLRKQSERLRIMREIDQAILTAMSSQEIADVALKHLVKLVPCWRASVTLFELEDDSSSVLAIVGAGADLFPVGGPYRLSNLGVDLEDLRAGLVHLAPDVTAIDPSPGVRALHAVGLRSYFRAPLMLHGDLIGSLTLSFDRGGAFTGEDVEIAREIAEPLAVAIEQARLHERVLSSRAQLQVLSRRLVEVQETERAHLARELHDEIGQLLTGLKLTLETLPPPLDDSTAPGLVKAKTQVTDIMARVRALSLDLRPAALDDLGLVDALAGLFGRITEQTRIGIGFEQSGVEGRRFSREIETASYRIVQEALTNVARYAGVDSVMVRAWADERHLGVQVEDRGVGFVPGATVEKTHTGLVGMRERVTLLGGHLEIESAPGAGTRITAEFPRDH